MYVPNHFSEIRREVLHDFIRAHPLGIFVTLIDSGLEANHIPFYLASDRGEHGSLMGHVARSNPVWRNSDTSLSSLVIFHGASNYISPSWYRTKEEHGKVVPTWNYAVVHAQGKLLVHDDPAWIREQVGMLTSQMEAQRESPWAVSDAPPEYVDRMVQGIVGIELAIERLIGKWKVSQNQADDNAIGVADGLESLGDTSSMEMAMLIRGSRN